MRTADFDKAIQEVMDYTQGISPANYPVPAIMLEVDLYQTYPDTVEVIDVEWMTVVWGFHNPEASGYSS